MQIHGRIYNNSNDIYRYGYGGKEKDNSTGEGNLDFGSRILDTRLGGRWLSPDPKATKYPSESPYIYVSNNPLIFTDPDGEEKIVVTGGANMDPKVNNPMMFIQASKVQLKNYLKEVKKMHCNEGVSWLIYDRNYSSKQKQDMNSWAKKNHIQAPIFVNSADEAINYINYKNVNGVPFYLTYGGSDRSKDQISDLSFMSHGMGGQIALGYRNTFCGSPDLRESYSIDLEKTPKFLKLSFADDSRIDLFSCNSASPPSFMGVNIGSSSDAIKLVQQGNNVLTSLSVAVPQATVTGVLGQTTYSPVKSDQLPAPATTGGDYSPRINGNTESPSLKLKAQNGNVTQTQ